jgi:ATP-dependent RNA helicase DHX57
MRSVRSSLPAAAAREAVLAAVARYAVVVINGETGCGKSTQVPQFLLEAAVAARGGGGVNIVVTQPRRISAISLAERVAAERGEPCGKTVGYTVRLESCRSERTRLLFCTTGVLLRRLLSDPSLSAVSHLVLDEVHERSLDSDLLLLMLRNLLARASHLKVVLMSATAEAGLFQQYFERGSASGGVAGVPATSLLIPGFTHPVAQYFLHDVLEATGYAIGKASRWARKGKIQASVSEARSGSANALLKFDDDDDAVSAGPAGERRSASAEAAVPDAWDDAAPSGSDSDDADSLAEVETEETVGTVQTNQQPDASAPHAAESAVRAARDGGSKVDGGAAAQKGGAGGR